MTGGFLMFVIYFIMFSRIPLSTIGVITFYILNECFQAVERRGEMIVRILELRQVGRNNVEAAKKFFALQVSIIFIYII